MKKMTAALALLILPTLVFAQNKAPKMLLDKISFQVSAKQWVSTQSSLLSVSINVTLKDTDLMKARNEIMDRLNKIVKAQWHLIDFIRSQDSSGLEKLVVNASARVDQSALTSIYANAKSVSLPGAQYQITGVEFKPALEETQAIRAKIREELYKQVNDEITRINKAYPNQNYSLSQLVFIEGDTIPLSLLAHIKPKKSMQ